MPFTPFHFGPGAAVKAIAPRHFSFSVFAFSQILIDLEPLYFMLQGEWPVHRFFHSYLGANLIALTAYLLGRPLCGLCLELERYRFRMTRQRLRQGMDRISPTAAISGAIIGAYTHIALDSVMHEDLKPWAPFSDQNALLHSISVSELHLYCAIAGLVGALGMGFWWLVRKEKETDDQPTGHQSPGQR